MVLKLLPVFVCVSFSQIFTIDFRTVLVLDLSWSQNFKNLFIIVNWICGFSVIGSIKYLCDVLGRSNMILTETFQVLQRLSKKLELKSHKGDPVKSVL